MDVFWDLIGIKDGSVWKNLDVVVDNKCHVNVWRFLRWFTESKEVHSLQKHFVKRITDEAIDAERKIGTQNSILFKRLGGIGEVKQIVKNFLFICFVLKLRALFIVEVLERYLDVQISVNMLLTFWHFCKIWGYSYMVSYLMLCWDFALFSVLEFYYEEFRKSKLFADWFSFHTFQTFLNRR